MTPYLERQIQYALVSGLLTAAVWWFTGLYAGLRASTRWRFVVSMLLIGVGCVAGVFAIRFLDHWQGSSQFGVIALAFYAGAFWLPLATWNEFVRRRQEIAFDGLLSVGCGALAVVGLYALLIEPNRLTPVEHEVRFEQWSKGTVPLRVVHISDLQTVGSCDREARAAEMINGLKPDLIVWCGDYIAGPLHEPEPAIAAARAFLGALRAKYGIVCVAGHSETEALRERILDGFDVHYLRNEVLELNLDDGRRLRVVGLTTKQPDFTVVDGADRPGTVTVVATHVPDVSWDLEGLGVDLHLAGHTHGGQIAVPGFGPLLTLSRLPREFAKGLHPFGDHWLNVTPGIGMEGNHAPRIRFLCPPEIHLLRLSGGGTDLVRRPLPERPELPWRNDEIHGQLAPAESDALDQGRF